MSAWAKPGVKCVCIMDATHTADGLPPRFPLFKKGQIFTVAKVHIKDEGVCLTFVECSPFHLGHIEGFRPLITRTQEQDLSLFTPLLETSKPGVDA